MLGEPVNLREQQDAVEFFMTLIDTIDEALKSLSHAQICSNVFGGVISDQKICKTCPHRYSRQEPCSVISVDVKNHSNLQDSLTEYTKVMYLTMLYSVCSVVQSSSAFPKWPA